MFQNPIIVKDGVLEVFFYIDINLIAKQMAPLKMIQLIARFSQQFATTSWKANFTFLPSDIQLI
jgi:hypothetical protein